jgi:ferredoxin-NADP reductase
MIAGPPKMVEAVGEEIKKTGVNKNRVKSESFSGYE